MRVFVLLVMVCMAMESFLLLPLSVAATTHNQLLLAVVTLGMAAVPHLVGMIWFRVRQPRHT